MELIKKNINDILDIEGKSNSFITNKPFSSEYINFASKWGKLPMYKDKRSVSNFFELLDSCQVVLLVSGTGSGKTVLVPKFFLKYIITMNLGGKIAVTNPKTLTTIYNAEYGAKTLDVKLGEEVGYKYKGAPADSSSENTRLLYCTDGLILATILSGDSLLREYQGVIIDEAHERHINIDVLLKLIKDILPKRPDFKLIIMSATINSNTFRTYFNTKDIKYGEMEVSGESNYAIEQHWLDKRTKVTRSNYVDLAVDRCLNIINNSDTGDILVFIPTTNDAIKGCQMVRSKCPSTLTTKKTTCDKLYCIEVYAKMKQSDKDMAVSKDIYKTKGYDRKIIFATNVAESSITFDGLVYVVESGYELGNYYDYKDNSYVVTKKYTSQAQIKQRIGRAGRTQTGVSYHLYTQDFYNRLNLYPEPNISVIDLTEFVLSFIKYSKVLKNMINLVRGLITIPKIEQVITALYKLHFIKCIKLIDAGDFEKSSDSTLLLKNSKIKWKSINSYESILNLLNGTATTIGYSILKFRSSPTLSALAIMMAYYLNCQKEIICIMAICEITNGKMNLLFDYNKKELNRVKDYFDPYIYSESDHLTTYNIYTKLYMEKQMKYLNKKIFSTIEDRIKRLEKYANSINKKKYEYIQEKYNLINKTPYSNQIDNIIYVLGLSHYYNLVKKESKMIYTSVNYLKNSSASLEFSEIMPDSLNIKHMDYAICHTLVNAFGNKSFQYITELPKKIIADIIKNENFE
jgi:HrpA-like RNA helicase